MKPERFFKKYEVATNTHDFANVVPLLAHNATYWFSDGAHNGIVEIEQAFKKTWRKIIDEQYEISNVRWVIKTPDVAVCKYHFSWKGKINGKTASGKGVGTNVMKRMRGSWKMIHEHLSSL